MGTTSILPAQLFLFNQTSLRQSSMNKKLIAAAITAAVVAAPAAIIVSKILSLVEGVIG